MRELHPLSLRELALMVMERVYNYVQHQGLDGKKKPKGPKREEDGIAPGSQCRATDQPERENQVLPQYFFILERT